MSRFVLTAQLQLQAPSNVRQVVNQIQSQLAGVNVPINVQNSTVATRQINQIKAATNDATTAAERMGTAFGVSLKRFASFSIATRAVGLFTSGLAGAIKDAIAFERELIKVAQVSNQSISSLKGLTSTITELATSLGVESKSLLEVSTILKQAGLSANDTSIALRTLAKAALAPNFDSITETTEGAIAILAQFGLGVQSLEGQLSSIDAVAGAFAVEASDLIDVIRRTGGVFKSSGGDLNELIALFTSVRATTRESAESIGTGLRTIFTRIQRPKTIEFLKQFGVELVDLEGKFVGPFEAVKRLSAALNGLGEGDLTFIRVAEELGGFRQIGKVLPLLQQFSMAQDALNVAQNAGNGLTQNAVTAQQALAIRITKVKEEFLAFVRGLTESKGFQIFVNTALNLASAFIKIGEALTPVIPLLTAMMAINISRGIGSFLTSIPRGVASNRLSGGGRVLGFEKGGLVPGVGNKDSVPAMLTPGEVVMNRTAVQKYGAGNLVKMNRYASGGYTIEKLQDSQKKIISRSLYPTSTTSNLELDDKVKANIVQMPANEPLSTTEIDKIRKAYPSLTPDQIERIKDGNQRKSLVDIRKNPKSASEQDITLSKEFARAERVWGQAYEQVLINRSKGKDSQGELSLANSGDLNYPVDVKRGNAGSETWGEVKFKTSKEPKKDLTAKLLAKRILDNQINTLFGENKPDPKIIDDVDLGMLEYYSGISKGDSHKLQFYKGLYLGGRVQNFEEGGIAQRRIGIIDSDVLRNKKNAARVAEGMKLLDAKSEADYAIKLSKLAGEARQSGALGRFSVMAGAAANRKSSVATGRGAKDDATLRKTTRKQILHPDDLQDVDQVMSLTTTLKDSKLDYMGMADRIYSKDSSTEDEQKLVKLFERQRNLQKDPTLYGRETGTTEGLNPDYGLQTASLISQFGTTEDRTNKGKVMTLGEKTDQEGNPRFQIRRKRFEELPELVSAKGQFPGAASPLTRGHAETAVGTLLAKVREKYPDATHKDLLFALAPDLSLSGGSQGREHGSRYGEYPASFRRDLIKLALPEMMISSANSPSQTGINSRISEIEKGATGRRRFAVMEKDAPVVISKAENENPEGVMERYRSAGLTPYNIARSADTEGDSISGTATRQAVIDKDYAKLDLAVLPQVGSAIKANQPQLRNRRMMVPLVQQALDIFTQANASKVNQQVDEILKNASGGPFTRMTPKFKESHPNLVKQIQQLRSSRDIFEREAFLDPAHELIRIISDRYPDIYGLDVSRKEPVDIPVNEDSIKQHIIDASKSSSYFRPGLSFNGDGIQLSPTLQKVKDAVDKEVKSEVVAEPKVEKEIVAPDSRSEIFKILSREEAAEAAGVDRFKAYDIMGIRKELTPEQQKVKDAIKAAYVKKVKRQGASAKAQTTKLREKGLEFGAAGLFGKAFAAKNIKIESDKLSSPRMVRVNSGVMDQVTATRLSTTMSQGVSDIISQGTNIVRAGQSKSPSTQNPLQGLNTNTNATIQGGLIEQIIQQLGGPGAVKGKGFDFPEGLQGAAKYFNIDPSIPTDVKRTLSGPSTIKDNIVTYLKNVMGYNSGGLVQKFPIGGRVSRKVPNDKVEGDPFAKAANSNTLGSSAYNLEKSSGLSPTEFEQAYQYAKTAQFNIEEFKKDLARRLEAKKQRSQIKTDPSSLSQQLMQQAKRSTDKQIALGKTLQDTSNDIGYRPSDLERIAQARADVSNATQSTRRRMGGRLGFETGGTVPALVSNGEAYVPPKVAKRIGYGTLNRMNQADRNGMSRFSDGGISVFKGQGSGTSDSIPANLPVGSFIIRAKATKALGLNGGGAVGIRQKFAGGGTPIQQRVSELYDQREALKERAKTATGTESTQITKQMQDIEKEMENLETAYKKLTDIIASSTKRESNAQKALDKANQDLIAKLQTKTFGGKRFDELDAASQEAAINSARKGKFKDSTGKDEFASENKAIRISSSVINKSRLDSDLAQQTLGTRFGGTAPTFDMEARRRGSTPFPFPTPSGGSPAGGTPAGPPDDGDSSGSRPRPNNNSNDKSMFTFQQVLAGASATLNGLVQTIGTADNVFTNGISGILSSITVLSSSFSVLEKITGKNISSFKDFANIQRDVSKQFAKAGKEIGGAFGGNVGRVVGSVVGAFTQASAAFTLIANSMLSFSKKSFLLEEAKKSGDVEGARSLSSGVTAQNDIMAYGGYLVGALAALVIAVTSTGAVFAAISAGSAAAALPLLALGGTVAVVVGILGGLAVGIAGISGVLDPLANALRDFFAWISTLPFAKNMGFKVDSTDKIASKDALVASQAQTQKIADKKQREQTLSLDLFSKGKEDANKAFEPFVEEASANIKQQKLFDENIAKATEQSEKDKLESEKRKSFSDFEKKASPIMDQSFRNSAVAGQSFDEAFSQLPQGLQDFLKSNDEFMKTAKKSYESNLLPSVQANIEKLKSLNFGLDPVISKAKAASLSIDLFNSSLQVGSSSIADSVKIIEAGLTNAASNIDMGQFNSAVSQVGSVMSNLGASEAQVKEFTGTLGELNNIQSSFGTYLNDIKNDFAAKGKSPEAKDIVEAFKDKISKSLDLRGVAPEVKKRITNSLKGLDNLSAEQRDKLVQDLETNNLPGITDMFGGELAEELKKQLGPMMEPLMKANEALARVINERVEAEKNLVSAQRQAIDLSLEGLQLQAKYGGDAVTPEVRRQAALESANVGRRRLGLEDVRGSDPNSLRAGLNQTRLKFSELEQKRLNKGAMGPQGVEDEAIRTGLKDAQQDQVKLIRDLISAEEEQLKLTKEKNKLEKDSLESLLAGDIDKFFEQQAAVGATAAIASGNTSAINQFGGQALGGAYQNLQRQKDAGVTELYGQRIAGTGGLLESSAMASLGSRGIQNPRMAQILAGTTQEEEASSRRLREYGGLLGEAGAAGAEMAQMEVARAEMNVEKATINVQSAGGGDQLNNRPQGISRGGIVYASKGQLINFVPKGTDTVPAMLTPGEFVINRGAVNRGDNLSFLRAINNGNYTASAQRLNSNNTSIPSIMKQLSGSPQVIQTQETQKKMVQNERSISNVNFDVQKLSKQLGKFMSGFDGFMESFSDQVGKLGNTEVSHKMGDVNLNINGGQFLQSMADGLKQQLMQDLGQQLQSIKVNNVGNIKLGRTSVL